MYSVHTEQSVHKLWQITSGLGHLLITHIMANHYILERKKGIILVIFNETFDCQNFENRKDALADKNSLDSLNKVLCCELVPVVDGTKQEVEKKIDDVVRHIQKADVKYEWLMVIVSTHGGIRRNARIYNNDHALMVKDSTLAGDNVIFTRDLVAKFGDMACPALKDKPKLFFIQACRGI